MPESAYQDRPDVWPGKCFQQAAIVSRFWSFALTTRCLAGQVSGEAANHSRVRQQGAISGLEAGRQGETIPLDRPGNFASMGAAAESKPQKLFHAALPQRQPEATDAGNSMTVSRTVGASSGYHKPSQP